MRIAIIPARKGSKRIKNKNIKRFAGKPIIYWSIKMAQKSKLFDKIIVSTDCPKIAKISKKFGAEIPFLRPKKFSDDFVNVYQVVQHAIKWFKKKDIFFKDVCCIYPTAPFISKKLIHDGLNLLNRKKKLFSFVATTFPHSIERAFEIKGNGEIVPVSKKNETKRSQYFKTMYHDVGQLYWGKPEAFLKSKKIFSNNSVAIKIPRFLAHDINTPEEWSKAELVFKTLKKNKKI